MPAAYAMDVRRTRGAAISRSGSIPTATILRATATA